MVGGGAVFFFLPRDAAEVVLRTRVAGDFAEALLRLVDPARVVLGDALLEPEVERVLGGLGVFDRDLQRLEGVGGVLPVLRLMVEPGEVLIGLNLADRAAVVDGEAKTLFSLPQFIALRRTSFVLGENLVSKA